ncbi:MAG: glycoside hydrolase family 31 protein [Atopobiaceae bacterium]|nr:glycoside hydrolase family 31 protein [Atopobiaceae bacterium]
MRFDVVDGALVARRQGETLCIEAWGVDALRVRATRYPQLSGSDWALVEKPAPVKATVETCISDVVDGDTQARRITNGRISCEVNSAGVLSFYRDGSLILREHFRNYEGTLSRESHCLKMEGRTYKAHIGGDWRIQVRFEANAHEKIFGMGQYQQAQTNLKGCVLDLEQRNSQVSVPFCVSSLGYGFLWNNPAVGRVTFGENVTEWITECSKELDYWICAGGDPKDLLEKYTAVTGRAPVFPKDLMGLWQCKLRYRTQEEVLAVAHECRRRKVPIDVIVIDFFHWPRQGDWCFDPTYWPDPKAMCDELHAMGIKVCVSVWPSVDKKSSHFEEMWERGLLIRTERGTNQTYEYQGDCLEIDCTNPEAREYLWDIIRTNYADLGIDMFWLDNAEPDFAVYDFDNYRYWLGPALSCSNIYPQWYSRAIYDAQLADGWDAPVNLLRSGWAGSQRYGNVVWSGDVPGTFEALRDQLQCGINMGLAGIPWWTTDVGGFMADDWHDPDFIELLVRWFQFGTFTAVLRLHGNRGPYDIEPLDDREFGGGYLFTGQPTELWQYGEEAEKIMRAYLAKREELKPYLAELFAQASADGSPLLRALFYEFPKDDHAWETYDEFMCGPRYLVAPVLELGMREREVYLPEGEWRDTRDGSVVTGPAVIVAAAPLDSIPVYERMA